jgi:hypothetical protein
MKGRPAKIQLAALGLYIAFFAVTAGFGGMAYFHFGNPRQTCASCHEMGGVHSEWASSGHRTLHCRNCHGGSITLDAHALSAHFNRLVQHFTGDKSKPVRLAERDVLRAQEACRGCHPQSYTDWKSSGHSATYTRIFLNPDHNKQEQLADDCLRCHGMFFNGSMADLVAPLDKSGPWTLKDPAKADQPAIPCLACHHIHTLAGEKQPAKAHFYDCRENLYFPVTALPAVAFTHEGRAVQVAKDPHQRLCLQCHAPSAAQGHRLGSSDDRTPFGVHEGLSCLDCHQPHNNSAKAACSGCHPAVSHCGLDVEKMDTSFFSKTSEHNIHTVACRDCHPRGVPGAAQVEPHKVLPGAGER